MREQRHRHAHRIYFLLCTSHIMVTVSILLYGCYEICFRCASEWPKYSLQSCHSEKVCVYTKKEHRGKQWSYPVKAGPTFVIREQAICMPKICERRKCFSAFRACPHSLLQTNHVLLPMLQLNWMPASSELETAVVQSYAQVSKPCWETDFKLRAGSQLADRASLVLSAEGWADIALG